MTATHRSESYVRCTRSSPDAAVGPVCGGPAAFSAACSRAVKMRDSVMKRAPPETSIEKLSPEPGMTSMMSWVCSQVLNCAPPNVKGTLLDDAQQHIVRTDP